MIVPLLIEVGHSSILARIREMICCVARIGSGLLKGLLKYSSRVSLPPLVRVKSSLWKMENSSSLLKRERSSYVVLSISMLSSIVFRLVNSQIAGVAPIEIHQRRHFHKPYVHSQ